MNETFAKPELVCPAGTPAALRTAVDAGADAVYCGLANETNARNFAGLNFTPQALEQSIAYAHDRGAKVLLAVNSFATSPRAQLWFDAVDLAARLRADAVIVADIGVASYAVSRYPGLRLHLSVQAGASSPEAIRYYCEEFGISRVVLPRILTVPEIDAIHREIPCEIEAFVFGNIGMMAEGRCSLTNYVTGVSTNMNGVCSPASDVRYVEHSDGSTAATLGDFEIDCYAAEEKTGYPTICKGRYMRPGREEPYYAFEEPVSLNLSALLPDLVRAGVSALKIEGRQRSRSYVHSVVSAYRRAVDDVAAGRTPDLSTLAMLTEGGKQTQGAYATKKWR
ncbi:ubiquinone anaerobic biosynthesis protein UbiU [Oricola nitratireducens]|uniref:ubiquinone anaerobic biosynthesis protein UbiU n=1 Tax=Oricola nitratireducens TaxID=2775868 RepID=UPI0018674460|nr:peptidase U32 family protein [Oricola nitratireducens]